MMLTKHYYILLNSWAMVLIQKGSLQCCRYLLCQGLTLQQYKPWFSLYVELEMSSESYIVRNLKFVYFLNTIWLLCLIILLKAISDTLIYCLERLILSGLRSDRAYILAKQSILICAVPNTGNGMLVLVRKIIDQRTKT